MCPAICKVWQARKEARRWPQEKAACGQFKGNPVVTERAEQDRTMRALALQVGYDRAG